MLPKLIENYIFFNLQQNHTTLLTQVQIKLRFKHAPNPLSKNSQLVFRYE